MVEKRVQRRLAAIKAGWKGTNNFLSGLKVRDEGARTC